MRCANASATRNPALCRVSRYFSPGLPSPTTSSLDDRPTSSASGPPAGAADEPARVDRRRSAGRRTARPGRWKARQHDVAARSWRARRLMCMARERCWLRELCRAVSGKRARRRWWWEISRVVGSSRARWAAESTGPGYVRIPLSPSNSARSRNRDGSRRTRRPTAPPRPSSGRLQPGISRTSSHGQARAAVRHKTIHKTRARASGSAHIGAARIKRTNHKNEEVDVQ